MNKGISIGIGVGIIIIAIVIGISGGSTFSGLPESGLGGGLPDSDNDNMQMSDDIELKVSPAPQEDVEDEETTEGNRISVDIIDGITAGDQ